MSIKKDNAFTIIAKDVLIITGGSLVVTIPMLMAYGDDKDIRKIAYSVTGVTFVLSIVKGIYDVKNKT